jgi:hypothetical protein
MNQPPSGSARAVPPGLDGLVEDLAALIRSDGADLTAEADGRLISFRLHIPDEACADCVLPSSMLATVFQHQVDNALGPGWTIEIEDPRDAGTPR